MKIDAATLLKKASETLADRSAERDVKKERAMGKTVAMFNAAFGTNLTAYQGWMFMIFLKIARANGGRFREDDYLDMSAYSALAGEARSEEQPLKLRDLVGVVPPKEELRGPTGHVMTREELDRIIRTGSPEQG